MSFVNFGEYIPADSAQGLPLGHSAQLYQDVNQWIRAQILTVPNDGSNEGVEVLVHWTLGIIPPSIVRFGHGWSQWREFLADTGERVIRDNAFRQDSYTAILDAWGPVPERRNPVPHEMRQAEENRRRDEENEQKGHR